VRIARSLAAALVVVLHWAVAATHPVFHGDACFGPRYLADTLPILALFLARGLHELRVRRAWLLAFAIAFVASTWIH
jgi:hypothetical protein